MRSRFLFRKVNNTAFIAIGLSAMVRPWLSLHAKNKPKSLFGLETIQKKCVGPSTPTPEDFAEALFTDTSTWAVTDRGRLEAMVPATDVLQKAYRQISAISPPDSNKKKLEVRYRCCWWCDGDSRGVRVVEMLPVMPR